MKKKHVSMFAIGALVTGLSCMPVYSSGFAVQERSIKGLGRAFSAEAAMGDDASVLASNPASIIGLDAHSYSFGLSVIDGHFGVDGTSLLSGPAQLREADLAPGVIIPSLYYTNKLNDQWSYGVGAFTNFGLKSEYEPAFAGSAISEKSELITLNINPSVAYRVDGNWSVGAGLSLVLAESELTGRNALNPAGRLRLEGDDVGFGYNLGVLYDNQNGTKVGLSYRSSIALELEGDGVNTLGLGVPVPLEAATAAAKLPGIVELSVVHRLDDKWQIHGDVQYTRWNSFQRLQSSTVSGAEILNNTESWENTYKFAVGATYQASDKLTVRFGAAYDSTPVTSSSLRTLRIPDSDRFWLSCGLSYKLKAGYELDFGYTYVMANEAQINEPAAGNGTFTGAASGFSHLFGIGISGSF